MDCLELGEEARKLKEKEEEEEKNSCLPCIVQIFTKAFCNKLYRMQPSWNWRGSTHKLSLHLQTRSAKDCRQMKG